MPSLLVVGVIVAAALLMSIILISSLGDPDEGTTATDPDAATTVVETTALADLWRRWTVAGRAPTRTETTAWRTRRASHSSTTAAAARRGRRSATRTGTSAEAWGRRRHDLSAPATGQLDVTFGATPWSAAVHVADELPTSFEGWGAAVDSSYSADAQAASFDLSGTSPGTC